MKCCTGCIGWLYYMLSTDYAVLHKIYCVTVPHGVHWLCSAAQDVLCDCTTCCPLIMQCCTGRIVWLYYMLSTDHAVLHRMYCVTLLHPVHSLCSAAQDVLCDCITCCPLIMQCSTGCILWLYYILSTLLHRMYCVTVLHPVHWLCSAAKDILCDCTTCCLLTMGCSTGCIVWQYNMLSTDYAVLHRMYCVTIPHGVHWLCIAAQDVHCDCTTCCPLIMQCCTGCIVWLYYMLSTDYAVLHRMYCVVVLHAVHWLCSAAKDLLCDRTTCCVRIMKCCTGCILSLYYMLSTDYAVLHRMFSVTVLHPVHIAAQDVLCNCTTSCPLIMQCCRGCIGWLYCLLSTDYAVLHRMYCVTVPHSVHWLYSAAQDVLCDCTTCCPLIMQCCAGSIVWLCYILSTDYAVLHRTVCVTVVHDVHWLCSAAQDLLCDCTTSCLQIMQWCKGYIGWLYYMLSTDYGMLQRMYCVTVQHAIHWLCSAAQDILCDCTTWCPLIMQCCTWCIVWLYYMLSTYYAVLHRMYCVTVLHAVHWLCSAVQDVLCDCTTKKLRCEYFSCGSKVGS